jgi:hypothetical protein
MTTRREFIASVLFSSVALAIPSRLFANADPWRTVFPAIRARIKPPHFPNRTFYLSRFGAKPDGRTDCTAAFRAAIDQCSKAGEGGNTSNFLILASHRDNFAVSDLESFYFRHRRRQDPYVYDRRVQHRPHPSRPQPPLPLQNNRRREVSQSRGPPARTAKDTSAHFRRRLLAQKDLSVADVARRSLHGRTVLR